MLNHHAFRSPAMLVCCGVLLSSLFSGCTGSGGKEVPEKLIQVSGNVTLNGEALANATVNFVPQNGTEGLGGYGITDASGKFEVIHYSSTNTEEPILGLDPGNYNVSFSKFAKPDGSPVAEDEDAGLVGAIEHLPRHLTEIHPEQHKFIVTPKEGMEPIQFDLKAK